MSFISFTLKVVWSLMKFTWFASGFFAFSLAKASWSSPLKTSSVIEWRATFTGFLPFGSYLFKWANVSAMKLSVKTGFVGRLPAPSKIREMTSLWMVSTSPPAIFSASC